MVSQEELLKWRVESMWKYLNAAGIYTIEELKEAVNQEPTKEQQEFYTYINTPVDFEKFKQMLPNMDYYKKFKEKANNLTEKQLDQEIEKAIQKVEDKKAFLENEKKYSIDRIKNAEFNLYRADFELNLLKDIKQNKKGA